MLILATQVENNVELEALSEVATGMLLIISKHNKEILSKQFNLSAMLPNQIQYLFQAELNGLDYISKNVKPDPTVIGSAGYPVPSE